MARTRKLTLERAQSLIDKATGRERGTKESEKQRRTSSTSKYGPRHGDEEAAQLIGAYAATHFATFPEIQPHELDLVVEFFESAARRGLKGVDAADYVVSELKGRRSRTLAKARLVQQLRCDQARVMREKRPNRVAERHEEQRGRAEAALVEARHQFPLANETSLIDQAAEQLGVSPSTVYRWLNKKTR